jgi:hypothetical protein
MKVFDEMKKLERRLTANANKDIESLYDSALTKLQDACESIWGIINICETKMGGERTHPQNDSRVLMRRKRELLDKKSQDQLERLSDLATAIEKLMHDLGASSLPKLDD